MSKAAKAILYILIMVISVIYTAIVFSEEDINKITDHITSGKSVIIMSHHKEYMVANTLKG